MVGGWNAPSVRGRLCWSTGVGIWLQKCRRHPAKSAGGFGLSLAAGQGQR